MTDTTPRRLFQPGFPDPAGVITWVHIGDLHMTEAGEQNHLDLIAIVDQVNRVFAGSLAFVYLPGDVAEHGAASEYTIARKVLDHLKAPWCSIVGDHDVHERSFTNYTDFAQQATHYAFSVGRVRFIALNAFDTPHPASFCLLPEQLRWLEEQIHGAASEGDSAVLLLHCYPTDLKQGGERLRELIGEPAVRLIDMGHTHYNELANDGKTLYTATRSTGQIEEGPVGFSITNIDASVISWKFVALARLPVVMITSPADERFVTDPALEGHLVACGLRVRAKVWGQTSIQSVIAHLNNQTTTLRQVPQSNVWEGDLAQPDVADGIYPLRVAAEDAGGGSADDCIRVVLGASAYKPHERRERDQDNAFGEWPERGLLGTQLGPNKNGRKW